MKKVSFVVGKDYLNNRIFDLSNPILNRDDCLRGFFLMREEFTKRGYSINTFDICNPKDADIVLYNEMPKYFHDIDYEKSVLMIFETELIRPDNWDKRKHEKFKKIFTWRDNWVDGKKYFKFNFPNTLKQFDINQDFRPKFLTLISGNKTSNHSLELYSERKKTIKWYEENSPDDFEYYGMGWDYYFDVWWQKVFKKLKILQFFPKNKGKCYRGKVNDKYSTLLKYQFAICYENGKEIEGYITEKILDCFFAGCIPVYWGASNITRHIPDKTFISREKFNSIRELHDFLKSITLEDIKNYQFEILKFLNSDAGYRFSNEYFAKNIVDGILNEK